MSFRRVAAFISLVGLLTFSQIAGPISAQEQQGGSGLSVSPTRTEYTIEPGKADTLEITLKNVSGIDIIAKATINDFEADNETGEPRLLTDTDEQTEASIRNFLVDLDDVELKKDESKTVTVPVQVPEDAVSGAYYGIIRYTAVPANPQANDAGQVALNASVGILTLVQVPGDIREQIQVEKVTAEKYEASLENNQKETRRRAAVTIRNTGNGFSKPFGRVAVKDWRGKEVYSYELNNSNPRSNVLPNSTRTFRDDLKNVDKLGRYTIVANISHGTGSEVITMEGSFWVLPVWFIVLSAVVVLGLILGAYLLYRRFAGRGHRRR